MKGSLNIKKAIAFFLLISLDILDPMQVFLDLFVSSLFPLRFHQSKILLEVVTHLWDYIKRL